MLWWKITTKNMQNYNCKFCRVGGFYPVLSWQWVVECVTSWTGDLTLLLNTTNIYFRYFMYPSSSSFYFYLLPSTFRARPPDIWMWPKAETVSCSPKEKFQGKWEFKKKKKKVVLGEGQQWVQRLLRFHGESRFLLCCCYFNKTAAESAMWAGSDPDWRGSQRRQTLSVDLRLQTVAGTAVLLKPWQIHSLFSSVQNYRVSWCS